MWMTLFRMIAFVSGTSLNVLLLFMIVTKTPPALRNYAKVITVHAFNDLLNCLVYFLGTASSANHADRVYWWSESLLANYYTPFTAKLILELFLMLSIYVPLSFAAIDFLFRYKAVVQGRELTTRGLMLYVVIAYTGSAFVAFYIDSYPLEASDKSEAYAHTDASFAIIQASFDEQNATFPYVSHLNTHPFAIAVLFLDNAVVLLQYVYIAFVTVSIKLKLRGLVQTPQTISIQRQITIIMACHALMPLTVCAPVAIHCFFALLQLDMILVARVISTSFAYFPVIKPLVVLTVVHSYRRALFGAFRKGSTADSTKQTSTHVVSQAGN